jgi:hypothetical protein
VISLGEAREFALSLPGAHEESHSDNPSFRVEGRIFANVPGPHELNVLVDPFDVEGAVQEGPEACRQPWWGKRLRGVQVLLPPASTRAGAFAPGAGPEPESPSPPRRGTSPRQRRREAGKGRADAQRS